MDLYSISGARIASFHPGERAPGNYRVRIGGGAMSAGVYISLFKAGNIRESRRLKIAK
jgi:hypothetical protein